MWYVQLSGARLPFSVARALSKRLLRARVRCPRAAGSLRSHFVGRRPTGDSTVVRVGGLVHPR
jgi:hypothetical protein